MELLVWCSSWCDYSISHPINVAHCWSVDVCDYSIYDPCDAATQLMFRLTRLLNSCYIRTYFGAINEIPVILECTLVLSMRFLLYSNVLWCYQWDSCYIRGYYFGAINVSSSMKRQLPKNSISVVIDLAFGNGCDKETQYRSINSATVVYVYGSQGDICHVI